MIPTTSWVNALDREHVAEMRREWNGLAKAADLQTRSRMQLRMLMKEHSAKSVSLDALVE